MNFWKQNLNTLVTKNRYTFQSRSGPTPNGNTRLLFVRLNGTGRDERPMNIVRQTWDGKADEWADFAGNENN
jgi:hypothetical protein